MDLPFNLGFREADVRQLPLWVGRESSLPLQRIGRRSANGAHLAADLAFQKADIHSCRIMAASHQAWVFV